MVTSNEAVAALKAARLTQKRSAEAYGYGRNAPYFFVWGIAWMIGYCGCSFRSDLFDSVMPIAMWGGIAGSVAVSFAQRNAGYNGTWRLGAAFAIMWIFTYALFAIFPPNPLKIAAYFPLLFAALYAGVGLWLGLRYVALGAFLGVATVGGYFLLPDVFFSWMAVAGGGSLVLTGFWLRRA